MKKLELVYNYILEEAIENKTYKLIQKALSNKLKLSLSTVNHALKPLRNMGAIKVNLKNFDIINIKKVSRALRPKLRMLPEKKFHYLCASKQLSSK